MKLTEILNEIDRGDFYLAQQAEKRQQMQAQKTDGSKGFWLIDRASGKRLAGPFKNDDDAIRFKQNRKDRIPADARIVHM